MSPLVQFSEHLYVLLILECYTVGTVDIKGFGASGDQEIKTNEVAKIRFENELKLLSLHDSPKEDMIS